MPVVATEHPTVDGVRVWQAMDEAGRPIPGPRVVVVGQVHGNEPVGRHVLARLAEVVRDELVAGTVVGVLANLEAMALDVRFTPGGRDLNRLWDRDSLDRLAATPAEALPTSEERRVKVLAPVVLDADVILDLHSTSQPAPAHLVLRDDLRHAEMGARLGVARLVTGLHEGAILDGGVLANAGLRVGERSNRLGFTLEAGQHQDPTNVDRGWGVLTRLLHALGCWRTRPAPVGGAFEVYEVVAAFRQAPAHAEPYRFVGHEGGEPGGGRHGPPRRLASFEAVEAGEVMLRRGHHEVIRAEAPFTMLMPAPTASPGEDLYYVCKRRHAALQTRPRTHAAARKEALAVERVLDLLRYDESERGVLTASFSSRRTLDLCADLIARVRRLPVGHPHRRLTVVGRGDWGGDEGDWRDGVRYRQAMSEALADGVPVDRVQLLRGAPFRWLEWLSEPEGPGTGKVHLWLSARQPHALALLIAGDPVRGLATGGLRYVQVGMVIEAGTVEADEGSVRTRIARAGLFGSRPALVRTALGLVRSLQGEHRALLRAGLLGALPADALDDRGALRLTDAPDRADLVARLRRRQLQGWRDLLRHDCTQVLHLHHHELGPWLARIMANTGILEARSLRRLLVHAEPDGVRVDPAGLDADEAELAALVEAARVSPAVPRAPIDGADVDRDDIEAWVSWTRFLREAESLPGQRGRDVVLAFGEAEVHTRLAAWLHEAREEAARHPGRRIVVVAGEGAREDAEALDPAAPARRFHEAHRGVVGDPHVHYLRIQNARGGHHGWIRGLVADLVQRAPSGAPVGMCWESEHGSTVSVVLVGELADGAEAGSAWDLSPWTFTRCFVVVSGAPAGADDDGRDAVAVGTAASPVEGRGPNQELLAFARSHCEGLVRQAGSRVGGRGGPALGVALTNAMVGTWAGWIARLREADLDAMPVDGEHAADRVARLLGVRDRGLAAALHAAARDDADPAVAARRLWSGPIAPPPIG